MEYILATQRSRYKMGNKKDQMSRSNIPNLNLKAKALEPNQLKGAAREGQPESKGTST
jgi:hypothetical protein